MVNNRRVEAALLGGAKVEGGEQRDLHQRRRDGAHAREADHEAQEAAEAEHLNLAEAGDVSLHRPLPCIVLDRSNVRHDLLNLSGPPVAGGCLRLVAVHKLLRNLLVEGHHNQEDENGEDGGPADDDDEVNKGNDDLNCLRRVEE